MVIPIPSVLPAALPHTKIKEELSINIASSHDITSIGQTLLFVALNILIQISLPAIDFSNSILATTILSLFAMFIHCTVEVMCAVDIPALFPTRAEQLPLKTIVPVMVYVQASNTYTVFALNNVGIVFVPGERLTTFIDPMLHELLDQCCV